MLDHPSAQHCFRSLIHGKHLVWMASGYWTLQNMNFDSSYFYDWGYFLCITQPVQFTCFCCVERLLVSNNSMIQDQLLFSGAGWKKGHPKAVNSNTDKKGEVCSWDDWHWHRSHFLSTESTYVCLWLKQLKLLSLLKSVIITSLTTFHNTLTVLTLDTFLVSCLC